MTSRSDNYWYWGHQIKGQDQSKLLTLTVDKIEFDKWKTLWHPVFKTDREVGLEY